MNAKIPHNPKPIRYQLNVIEQTGVVIYPFESDSPFPAIVAEQELLIEGKRYVVKHVTHDFSWTDLEMRCSTGICVESHKSRPWRCGQSVGHQSFWAALGIAATLLTQWLSKKLGLSYEIGTLTRLVFKPNPASNERTD
jgi:hypothetical protein